MSLMMNENAWDSSVGLHDDGAEQIHAVGVDTFRDDGEGFRW